MILRSMLFVPGDSERKLVKGAGSGADALVLDLEDAVAAERLPLARAMVREYLAGHRDRQARGRSCGCDAIRSRPTRRCPISRRSRAARPTASSLPKTTSAPMRVTLDHYLSALETREGVELGSIRIMAVATETPDCDVHARDFRRMQSAPGRDDLGRRGSFRRARERRPTRRCEGNLEFTYQPRALAMPRGWQSRRTSEPHRHGVHRFPRFRGSHEERAGSAPGGLHRQDRDSSGPGASHQRCIHAYSRRHRICEAGDRGIRLRLGRRNRGPRWQDAGHAASEAGTPSIDDSEAAIGFCSSCDSTNERTPARRRVSFCY